MNNKAFAVDQSATPFGRYRLVELLGRGGMGEVWRAFDTVTERVVAIKVLPAHLVDDKIFQQRFRREARAAASLNEPHVVPIYDFDDIDGRLYVSMRLIDGEDLQAVLDRGPLSPQRAQEHELPVIECCGSRRRLLLSFAAQPTDHRYLPIQACLRHCWCGTVDGSLCATTSEQRKGSVLKDFGSWKVYWSA